MIQTTKETAYDKHWNAQGEYGQERVRRKNVRKEKRTERRKEIRANKFIIGRCEYNQDKICDGCMDC